MAKRMMKLTVEEVRANIPYDLICMVRYGLHLELRSLPQGMAGRLQQIGA